MLDEPPRLKLGRWRLFRGGGPMANEFLGTDLLYVYDEPNCWKAEEKNWIDSDDGNFRLMWSAHSTAKVEFGLWVREPD